MGVCVRLVWMFFMLLFELFSIWSVVGVVDDLFVVFCGEFVLLLRVELVVFVVIDGFGVISFCGYVGYVCVLMVGMVKKDVV